MLGRFPYAAAKGATCDGRYLKTRATAVIPGRLVVTRMRTFAYVVAARSSAAVEGGHSDEGISCRKPTRLIRSVPLRYGQARSTSCLIHQARGIGFLRLICSFATRLRPALPRRCRTSI